MTEQPEGLFGEHDLRRLLEQILERQDEQMLLLAAIARRERIVMADLSALEAAATQLSTDVNSAVDLLNQLAAANPQLQAEIDAVTATLTNSTSSLEQALASDTPPPPPPAPAPSA